MRSSNDVLPTVMWTIAVRSVRYSTLPAFDSSTALRTSIVTVPTFGFGILPCGPRMRPSRPTTGIMSGVAIATSKSVKPSFWTRSARSSAPTKSAPASSASRALSPRAKTAILTSLPRPCGRAIVPRSCSSAWRTFRPVRTCSSTDSSNLREPSSLSSENPSAGVYSRSRSIFDRAWLYARPRLDNVHPHRAGGPGDDARRSLHVLGVEIGQLALGDLADLVLGDGAHLGAVRLARPLLEADRLLDQDGGRRSLGHEGERAVLVDGDHHRDDRARVALGLGVERLAELHDVDPVLSQGRTDRGSRAGGAAHGLKLDGGEDALGHG